jgi:hypothetical protein
MAGYSGTPLPRKLGIKDGSRVALVNVPAEVSKKLKSALASCKIVQAKPIDFVLLTAKSESELRKHFPIWSSKLAPAGMLWVSWPKKSSGVPSDLDENVVRKIGLADGLVDVKVCAVNDTWSGLKFVIRLKDR